MFIGIDVGLKHLDIAAIPPVPTLPRRVPNTDEGRAALVAALQPLGPTLIVGEATGTYHLSLVAALLLAELPVAVINPAQSAAFRKSQFGRNKTDRGDARLLARFAELHHATLHRAEPPDPDLAQLRELVGLRDDLIGQRTATRNRRHAAKARGTSAIVPVLDTLLGHLAELLTVVEADIRAVLARIPDSEVLMAQKGVAVRVAAATLAYLPAGVHGNAKAAAAYAGVHPQQEQSGQRDTSRLSKQGCPALRRYLYLAAQCAVRFDPVMRAWYEALQARGKAKQSALCAVAHTLLRQMMGRLKQARAERAAAARPAAAAQPLAA